MHSEIHGREPKHVTTNGNIGWIANYIWGSPTTCCVTSTCGQVPRRHPPDDRAAPAGRGPSPTSATRGQNAHNPLISGSRKPKVGTTRPRAEGEDKGDSDADSRRGLGR